MDMIINQKPKIIMGLKSDTWTRSRVIEKQIDRLAPVSGIL